MVGYRGLSLWPFCQSARMPLRRSRRIPSANCRKALRASAIDRTGLRWIPGRSGAVAESQPCRTVCNACEPISRNCLQLKYTPNPIVGNFHFQLTQNMTSSLSPEKSFWTRFPRNAEQHTPTSTFSISTHASHGRAFTIQKPFVTYISCGCILSCLFSNSAVVRQNAMK
jgi:hypothetical protein